MTHNGIERLHSNQHARIGFALGAIVLLCVCSLASWSWGQASTGTITGVVTDAQGALVPNAAVTVTNLETNVAVQTTTTATGDYTVPYLIPAHYKVAVKALGFETVEVKDIVLLVGQVQRANVTLKPGAESQTVTVEAASLALDTDSSAVGQVISQKQILELPMQNRNFLSLELLAPGAITTVHDNGSCIGCTGGVTPGDEVNISGARDDSNGYFIDGLTNNESYLGDSVVHLSLDAIQEFKEQGATYSAVSGDTPVQVNVTTKSGTNKLHGTVFEFVRNNALDAVSAFTPAGPVPPLHQNNYGYSLGGPVYIPKIYNGHDRTFFFANFERLTSKSSAVIYSIGPTSNLLSDPATIPSVTPILDPVTDLPFAQDSDGNYLIPSTRWSRLAKTSIADKADVFPVVTGSYSGNNSVAVVTNPSVSNQQTYRIDQKMGSKDSLNARFTLTNNSNTTGGFAPDVTASLLVPTQSWNAIETHTFNEHLVNNARVGWLSYNSALAGVPISSSDFAALGITNAFPYKGGANFPEIQFSNGDFTGGGGYFGVPSLWGSAIWNGEDSIYWTRGKHALTLGFRAVIDQSTTAQNINILGEYTFDGSYTTPAGDAPTAGNTWADFLIGDTVAGQAVVPTPWGVQHPSNPPYFINQDKYALYLNDDWKVSQKFTVNLGLRYDYQSVPDVQLALWASLKVPGGVVCTTDKQYVASGFGGSLIQFCPRGGGPKRPFAPRFGFEYSPLSKTVVRGGYGVYFDQFPHHEFDSTANYPWAETFSMAGYNSDQMFPAQSLNATPADVSGILNAEPPSVTNPYYQDWSFGVEQQLRQNMKLTVSYVGGMGTHLATRLFINQPYTWSATNTPAETAATFPYYNLGTYGLNGTPFSPAVVDQGQFVGASNYNSMQTSLDYRAKDTTLLASYTWASSMDDTSSSQGAGLDSAGWQGAMDAHDIHRDYAKSSFDVNQRFVLSCVYSLPFGRGKRLAPNVNRGVDSIIGGWQVNGIYTAQGGIPFNTSASDIGFVLEAYGQRSNRIGNPHPSGFKKSANEWFDTTAFAQPAEGMFGTEHRNDLRAPGVNNLDFSFFKNFLITEPSHPLTFQFRVEAFNALNHVQLGAPGSSLSASNFGVISGVQVPGRIVQIAGKLIF